MPNDDTLEQDLERELEQELLKVSRLCMRWGSHMQSRALNCTCVHVCCTPSNPENEYALRVFGRGEGVRFVCNGFGCMAQGFYQWGIRVLDVCIQGTRHIPHLCVYIYM